MKKIQNYNKHRKTKYRFIISTLILVLFSSNILLSLDIQTNAKIDTNDVLIGDQIKLSLEVIFPKNLRLNFPTIPDTIGKIEILARTPIDTIDSNAQRIMRQNLIITSFDSGYFEIPPFYFIYEKEDTKELYPIATSPLMVKFSTIPIDTADTIRDIKPPLDVPYTFEEFLPYIIGLLLLALTIYLVIQFLKRRKPKHKLLQDYDPKIPPHIIALDELRKLNDEKLWQKGEIKLYYTKLTDIIRTYIERRFNIMALEMTSDEILYELEKLNLDNGLIETSRKMYQIADLVKFAKFLPLPDEHSFCFNSAVEFVKSTIPVEISNGNKKEDK